MNNHQDTPRPLLPDQLRRRLIKGGISAPVVLATLSSKSVLGAAPHNCTISGQLSGNVSTHLQGTCSSLGKSPAYYASLLPASWPNYVADFYNPNTAHPRTFPQTPFSFSIANRFANAYEKEKTSGPPPLGTVNVATVQDVLVGYVVILNGPQAGGQNLNWTLKAKAGYVADLDLGREAIAAYMNAWDSVNNPGYPLSPAQVVQMFNAVVVIGGTYQVSPSNYWNATDVKNYFSSLHG